MLLRKTDTNQPKDVMLIDFQLSRVGSPASDIVYFLTSSTSLDSRKAHLEQWLQFYHNTLTEDLLTYGYSNEIFTYQDLLDEINHLWPFALECGIMHAEVCIRNCFNKYYRCIIIRLVLMCIMNVRFYIDRYLYLETTDE